MILPGASGGVGVAGVYGQGGALPAAVDWLMGTLLGTVAVTLCVLAVAFVGLAMLGGRMPVRQGARVVVGCFLVLGAPIVAAAFGGAWQAVAAPPPLPPVVQSPTDPRSELPPANYDPYAGASLRRD